MRRQVREHMSRAVCDSSWLSDTSFSSLCASLLASLASGFSGFWLLVSLPPGCSRARALSSHVVARRGARCPPRCRCRCRLEVMRGGYENMRIMERNKNEMGTARLQQQPYRIQHTPYCVQVPVQIKDRESCLRYTVWLWRVMATQAKKMEWNGMEGRQRRGNRGGESDGMRDEARRK